MEEEEGELGCVEGCCERGVRGGGVSAAVEVWLVGGCVGRGVGEGERGRGGCGWLVWVGKGRGGRTVYEDLIPFLCEVGCDVCPYNRRHR